MKQIAIVDYNTSNLFSIANAIKKMNLLPIITSDHKTILKSDALILPGVGSFRFAMQEIEKKKLRESLIEFTKTGKLLFGICLGFQLLFDSSEEGKFTKGLGLIKGKVKKIENTNNKRVPHLGWNKVFLRSPKQGLIENNKEFYFVHSYYAVPDSAELVFSTTQYEDLNFCSSVKKENVFGCQFHPEKSGKNGINFLQNFLNKELNV